MMCYSTPYKTLQDILEHYNANKSEADKTAAATIENMIAKQA